MTSHWVPEIPIWRRNNIVEERKVSVTDRNFTEENNGNGRGGDRLKNIKIKR